MKKTLVLFASAIVLIFNSCSDTEDLIIVIQDQYLESVYGPAPTFTPVANPVKNVFLEEFTGHLCGFCPPATALANQWNEDLGERLVLMSVHAGTLAAVSSEPFDVDYNTEVGDVYWGQLEGGFNPSARINRVTGIANAYPYADWLEMINAELAEAPDAAMQMQLSYVPADGILNIHTHTQFVNELSGSYSLLLFVVESHVISPQEDYNQDPTEIMDYEHNHILRDAITGAYGLPISSNPVAGSEIAKSFSYQLSSSWVADNCEVIAALVDNATGEIINSVEAKIAE
jgi:hypothetical protein